MSVLVDTSVWVAYFRSGNGCEKLDFLIDENLIVINLHFAPNINEYLN
jgi:hypothetical protein